MKETIGERIGEFISKKGVTQRELAKAVGISEVTLSRYIKNERKPTAETVVKIAAALDVSTDSLINGITDDRMTKCCVCGKEARMTDGALAFLYTICRGSNANLANNRFCADCADRLVVPYIKGFSSATGIKIII